MGDNELRNRSICISSDVDDLLETNDLAGIEDLDELSEFVNTINETKKEYRRVHAIIKDSEGEAFEMNYPAYTDTQKRLNDTYKSATDKLRGLKKQGKHQAGPRESNYDAAAVMQLHLGEKKLQCKSEYDFFIEQAIWELDDCDWAKFNDTDEIKSQITLFENRLSEFFRICSDLKGYYGQEFEGLNLKDSTSKLVERLRTKVNSGKKRTAELKNERSNLEQRQRAAEVGAQAAAEAKRVKEIQLAEQEKV